MRAITKAMLIHRALLEASTHTLLPGKWRRYRRIDSQLTCSAERKTEDHWERAERS